LMTVILDDISFLGSLYLVPVTTTGSIKYDLAESFLTDCPKHNADESKTKINKCMNLVFKTELLLKIIIISFLLIIENIA
ncbi:MAG: hypothetical protein WCE54_05830, partial [Ignavibacteriaceae bacterium]